MRPAFYADTGTRWGDLVALLHPPYTAWNMSYAAMGAALAPAVDGLRLALTLGAFFAGTGIASHALDELNGRPLKTGFSDRELKLLAIVGFAGGLGCAAVAAIVISPWILAFAAVGSLLVAAYSLEWFGGLVHTDLGFALAWGAFPVLTGYWAQAEAIPLPAVLAAAAATLLSLAQRRLSTYARFARRKAHSLVAVLETSEGPVRWSREELLATWEAPLKLLAWTVTALAAGMLSGRFSG